MPSIVSTIPYSYQSNAYHNGYGYNTPNPSSWPFTDLEYKRRSKVWSRTSNYRSILKSQGWLPTLPYTDDQISKQYSEFVASFPTLNQGCWVDRVIPNSNLPNPNIGHTDYCLQKAISNAAGKVGDSTVNLGVTGAEAGKTIRMFNNAVTSLATAARQVKSGQFGKAASTLGLAKPPRSVGPKRSFANNWLEYRYGWRTLMMDVDGAVRHLAQVVSSRPTIMMVKSTVKDSVSWEDTLRQPVANTLPYPGIIVETVNRRSYTYDLQASITYRYEMSSPGLSQGNQLGLVNPLEVAWELIPYSFVVDWFVNVGDVIHNMTSFVGKKLLDGCQTRAAHMKCTTKVLEVWTGSVKGQSASATNVASRRLFDRQSIGWLSPSIRIHVNLSTNRLIDAAALLRQRFSH